MYNIYEERENVDIDTRSLQRKTDEELEEFCIELLGDIQQSHPKALYSSYFTRALSDDNSLRDLAVRIAEDRDHRRTGWRRPGMDEDTMRSLEHDFGFGAIHNQPTPLLSLTKSALTSEVNAIVNARLIRNGAIPKEEFDRRIRLLTTFCNQKTLEEFVGRSLSYEYYASSVEDLEKSFVDWNGNNTKISTLRRDLPNFLKLIASLLDAGIDLSTIKMQQGFTALEAYNIIKDRFGKYIQGEEIVEPEVVQEESATTQQVIIDDYGPDTEEVQQDSTSPEVSSMLEDDSVSQLSAQEIQDKIDANNQQILELMAENRQLVAMLVERQELQQSSEKSM